MSVMIQIPGALRHPTAGRGRLSAGPRRSTPVALVLLCVAAGCGREQGGVREITRSRTSEPVGADIDWHVSSAERFGLRRPGPMPGAGPGGAARESAPAWRWITPPGWRELPPASLRQANFLVAGDERAQCYLTVMPGDGGGLVGNVNRWRGQMSLPDASAQDIDALPRVPFFEGEAVLVDLQGTWAGMGGEQAGSDYRLVGLALVDGASARFLKMIGPSSVVGPEVEAFHALAASFAPADPRVDDDRTPGAAEAAPTAGGGTTQSREGLAWRPPAGWRRGPERAMRVVTYLVGEGEPSAGEAAECYVSLLAGDGGGALPNVNRWRGQMGAERLTQEEFGRLTRLPMLGAQGILVEIEGPYRGTGGAVAEAALLGAICNLPGRAVYVKMIGPRALVQAEREAFLAFCKSMTTAK